MNSIAVPNDNEKLKEFRLALQSFMELLNVKPSEKDVKKNKFADNSDYIPIGVIENNLDSLFFGLWSTSNWTSQVIGNEIVGSIDLTVIHPRTGLPITRTGVAGTIIRQQSGAEITDINKKIKNALVMDYPHLKAECVKNACKSLGKKFGRDLNRDYTEIYKPLLADTQKEKEERRVHDFIVMATYLEQLHEVKFYIDNLDKTHKLVELYARKEFELLKTS